MEVEPEGKASVDSTGAQISDLTPKEGRRAMSVCVLIRGSRGSDVDTPCPTQIRRKLPTRHWPKVSLTNS